MLTKLPGICIECEVSACCPSADCQWCVVDLLMSPERKPSSRNNNSIFIHRRSIAPPAEQKLHGAHGVFLTRAHRRCVLMVERWATVVFFSIPACIGQKVVDAPLFQGNTKKKDISGPHESSYVHSSWVHAVSFSAAAMRALSENPNMVSEAGLVHSCESCSAVHEAKKCSKIPAEPSTHLIGDKMT